MTSRSVSWRRWLQVQSGRDRNGVLTVPGATAPVLRAALAAVRTAAPMAVLAAALGAVLVFSGLFVTGCGGRGPNETPPSAARTVNFTTEDGVGLVGHVFGSGPKGVILSHMYPADQSSWYPTAESLAQEGRLVLTFDFRGYGESSGQKDIALIYRDVTAAINEIRQEGASAIVLVGASMGGTASLIAGELALPLSSIRLAGVATLSAPVEFQGLTAARAVPTLAPIVPLLFIAAENDTGAAGANMLEQYSSGKGQLVIVPGKDHGTDLLRGSQKERVFSLLRQFIDDSLTP